MPGRNPEVSFTDSLSAIENCGTRSYVVKEAIPASPSAQSVAIDDA